MPRRSQVVGTLVVLAALLGALSACKPGSSGDSGDRSSAGTTYSIVVIPKGTTHDFWKMVHAGARRAEKELNESASGWRVKVVWKGPLKEDDTTEQQNIVDNYVGLGVSGICLAPLDRAALIPQVRSAKAAGIPVVIFDSGLSEEAKVGDDFLSYVATDNLQGGRLGARRLAEALGGKGRVAILRYQVGSESTTQREEGFLEVLAESYPEIEVVSKDQYAGATEADALQKAQNLLTSLEGRVDGLFCPNESSAAGMLGALRQAGLAGKVRFVGFDASKTLLDGLRAGHLDGLVLQNPVHMAHESVRLLVAHLRGEGAPPPRVDTGVVVVTPANVESPEMRALHSPDLSRWLEP